MTSRKKSLSLRTGLTLSLSVLILIMVAVMAFERYQRERSMAYEDVAAQIDSAQQRLSTSIPKAVWDLDDALQQRLLQAEVKVPFLHAIVVTGQDGKVLSAVIQEADGRIHSGTPEGDSDRITNSPIEYVNDGKLQQLGQISFHISYKALKSRLNHEIFILIIELSVFGLILIMAVSVLVSQTVLKPIDSLKTALEDIASGEADLSQRLPLGKTQEFLAISLAFNRFVERLETTIANVRLRCKEAANGTVEIATGNQDMAMRTEEQASVVQQSASAVNRLLESVSVNSEAANKVKQLAVDAEKLAGHGGAVMSSVVDVIGEISGSSQKITEIIGVIDGISFQTNILALNAAVEAARAGEQGRGFAVVASEVRALAARSAMAAKEIKTLINTTVETVAEGQRRVQQGGAAIRALVGAVDKVTEHIDQISNAASSQLQQITLVNQGITGADRAAQMNSALVEQISAATGAVSQSMTDLLDSLRAFHLTEDR